MPYRALAIDLDGTLLVGEDLSTTNRDAVRRARDAGMTVIIATARWKQMALRIAAQIGLEEPVIACSGAQVHLPQENRDIFDVRLPSDFVKELYAICDADRCIATVTTEDRVLFKLDGKPDVSQMDEEMMWVPKLADVDFGLPRVAAIQGTAVNARIRNELEPRYSDTVNFYDSIGPSGKIIITLTSKQADKGAALLSACAHLDLPPNEVVTFGDADNDITMFRVSGASVAMGQAADSVKAAATTTTAANTDDGVAHAINRLLDTGHP